MPLSVWHSPADTRQFNISINVINLSNVVVTNTKIRFIFVYLSSKSNIFLDPPAANSDATTMLDQAVIVVDSSTTTEFVKATAFSHVYQPWLLEPRLMSSVLMPLSLGNFRNATHFEVLFMLHALMRFINTFSIAPFESAYIMLLWNTFYPRIWPLKGGCLLLCPELPQQ